MKQKLLWLALAVTPLCALAAPSAHAANGLKCQMNYTISGWSVIYHAANGHGTVTCDNGKSMDVNLSATGAGLTIGKYTIDDGHGTFTGAGSIDDVIGTYGMARAHAGVVGSARAVAMTKGDVTLLLAGTGSGWNIGAGFSGFTISRANAK